MEDYNTGYCQTVTQPTANPARQGLTSVIGQVSSCEVSVVVGNGKPKHIFSFSKLNQIKVWHLSCNLRRDQISKTISGTVLCDHDNYFLRETSRVTLT